MVQLAAVPIGSSSTLWSQVRVLSRSVSFVLKVPGSLFRWRCCDIARARVVGQWVWVSQGDLTKLLILKSIQFEPRRPSRVRGSICLKYSAESETLITQESPRGLCDQWALCRVTADFAVTYEPSGLEEARADNPACIAEPSLQPLPLQRRTA